MNWEEMNYCRDCREFHLSDEMGEKYGCGKVKPLPSNWRELVQEIAESLNVSCMRRGKLGPESKQQ